MKKWFERCSVQTKLILSYTALALVPMLVIAVYTYFNTRDILLDSLYEELSAQLERTGKNLDEKLGDYYAVSNILYMDNTLQSYLTVDYSEKGFEDLYDYVDSLFSSILTFYPEISRISVYSSNETLPEDDFYFYYLNEKELPGWYEDASRAGGILHMEAEDGGIIGFTRQLNLYELGKYELFVKLWVPQEALNQMLDIGDDQVTLALLGRDGLVEASNQTALIGTCLDTESMDNQIVMQGEVDYGGTLVMYTDSRRFNASAEKAAKRILSVFLASMGMAMAAIYFYSRGFRINVEKVLKGARAIGAGQLDYQISEPGEDELGQIAQSVNQMGSYINTLIEDSYKKELARKNSELNLLQEQINPHFLYNALSSISSLAMCNRDRETSQAIVYLSEFYRISLNKGKQELTVREELKLLQSYLKIQKMRFGDFIAVEYELDETLLERRVVKLTLQPIVENAIHHGRTDDSDVFHILIRLFEEKGRTVFEVIDDGCGIEPEKLLLLQNSMNQSEGGYGLKNVNVRIKLQYGAEYGIYIESEPGFGTKVRIELPGAADSAEAVRETGAVRETEAVRKTEAVRETEAVRKTLQ